MNKYYLIRNVLMFLLLRFKYTQGRLLNATVSDIVRDKEYDERAV